VQASTHCRRLLLLPLLPLLVWRQGQLHCRAAHQRHPLQQMRLVWDKKAAKQVAEWGSIV
jgi:hypothetical protein